MIQCFESGEYFTYKGEHFLSDTIVLLSDEFLKKNPWVVSNEARFSFKCKDNGCYTFNPVNFDKKKIREIMTADDLYGYLYFYIPCKEIDNAIEKIIKPNPAILVKKTIPEEHKGIMIVAWIVYIFALIGSLIFREFHLLWIAETFLLLYFRRSLMK